MKLDLLITQYLYQQKRISLPGIGTFTMDGSAVKFDNKYDAAVSPDLIEFVKAHTGKMNSLALSDIESFIMLNKQFLNIGKALYLEGIGTLVKANNGSLEFLPGDMVPERLDDLSAETRKPSSFVDDNRYPNSSAPAGRGWLLGIALALTIALVIWGGWKLFNTTDPESAQQQATPVMSDSTPPALSDTTKLFTDTTRSATSIIDSTGVTPGGSNPVSTIQNSQWKFIIEQTANKTRAYKRFNQLKDIGSSIQLDNSDSLNYKLYFLIPANPVDTTRIKDSLRRFYSSRRVRIEQ